MMLFTLENKHHKITFLNHGASIYEWIVKSKNRNIVLTNKHLGDYRSPDTGFLGSTIGRVTNRIKDGRFSVHGQSYQLPKNFDQGQNAGHGGIEGFWNQPFNLISSAQSELTFQYVETDGQCGFPGDLTLNVTYTLTDETLKITYTAKTTQATPINITNHSYFNLSEEPTILNHRLQADSSQYLLADETNAVTGDIIDGTNTPMDLRYKKPLHDLIYQPLTQTEQYQGLDHCFLFDKEKQITLESEDLELTVTTSYPAVQIYTLGFPPKQALKQSNKINPFHGIALECQFETDAVNHSHFSNIILEPNETYKQYIEFTIKEGEFIHE
ncbi:MAG: aldose epimerase family protein [Acholeplasmataceae bacterium]|nr:galactose mutarotase [Acholeplasmataceae bacterium]